MMTSVRSMKSLTVLLMIIQVAALIIIISIYEFQADPKLPAQLMEIQSFIDSEDSAKKQSSVLIKGDICLDSEGVYRQCNDETYLAGIEKGKKIETHDEHEVSLAKEGRPSIKGRKQNNLQKNTETEEQNKFNISVTGKDDDDEKFSDDEEKDPLYEKDDIDSNISKEDADKLKEIRQEKSEQQFSGMGNMEKIISKQVKNAKLRFVSDKRILFSDVYEKVDSTEDVKLLVIVSSGAKKRARRDSIRGTWWSECKDSQVKCLFFTDDINSPNLNNIKRELQHESDTYKDMIFQPIDIGLKFGYRFLYQMQWAMAHYRFQYFLRVDDDVIVCLHHLLHDLQYIKTTNLQWGFLHCVSDGAVYMDEGLTMLTRDLIMKYLSQNPLKMRCHVYGDQQIATWNRDLNLDPYLLYVHDRRIHHVPAASSMKEYFNELDDMCNSHIIIHGVYPGDMDDFWEKPRRRKYSIYKPELVTQYCDLEINFVWHIFGYRYRHQPKYCHKNPKWRTNIMEEADGTFGGRESRPEEYDSMEQ